MYRVAVKGTNELLEIDITTNTITSNGKSTDKYDPVFIHNGDNAPDFFGYFNKSDNKVYDIYGGVRPISEESAITL